MKILAILQNMYFREPERARAILARYPDRRNYFIAQFLFMGCLTGRRLRQAFGYDLCDAIVWEEAHCELGDHSGSKFGFDAEHIKAAIEKHKPDIVLAFGKIASDGLSAAQRLIDVDLSRAVEFYAIRAPHPAARQNPVPELKRIAEEVRLRIQGEAV